MARPAKRRPAPAENDDPAAVPQPPEGKAPADPSLCPKCGGQLTNPDGLGWCPGCGYCRSLAEEKAVVAPPAPAPPKKPSVLGATEFGEAMRRMPVWVWPLLGGAAAVAGASVAADHCLPEEALPRALWSALQMVLGVVGLVAAQLWAVMLVGDREEGIRARDVILGGQAWRAALRRLPATRKPVWLGAWSFTAVVCGAAVVGGFEYWLEAVRGTKVRHMVAALEAGQPVATVAKEPTDEAPLASLAPSGARRQLAQCAVIGYQTDGTRVTALLLATADGNRLQFAGVVKRGISPQMGKDLLGELSRLARDEPLIPGLKLGGVRWVKPGVFCDVQHFGADKDGHLEQPAVKELRD